MANYTISYNVTDTYWYKYYNGSSYYWSSYPYDVSGPAIGPISVPTNGGPDDSVWYAIASAGDVANGIISGGYFYAESGGIIGSATVESGGYLGVYGGGSATFVSVNSGGELTVSGGAIGSLAIVNGGDPYYYGVYIEAGGSVLSANIGSGGDLWVYAGGSVSSAIVDSGGYFFVESGGSVSSADIESGGSADLQGQASVNSAMIASDCYLDIGAGASAAAVSVVGGSLGVGNGGSVESVTVSATVASGSNFYFGSGADVSAGGFVSFASIENGGEMWVESGGLALSAIVDSGGYFFVESGGSVSSADIESGASAEIECQISLGSVAIASDCYLDLGGGASAATVTVVGGSLGVGNGGSVESVTVSATVASGSNFYFGSGADVSAGGFVSFASIENGGEMWVESGGSVSSASVGSGGYFLVDSGGSVSNVDIESGGSADLRGQASVNSAMIASDCYLDLGGGASAASVSVDGGYIYVGSDGSATSVVTSNAGEIVVHGAVSSLMLLDGLGSSGGSWSYGYVESGGCVSSASIASEAYLLVESGGSVSSVSASSEGELTVENGGGVSSAGVGSGGDAWVESGGSVTSAWVGSGGYLGVESGGSLSSVDIESGGSADLECQVSLNSVTIASNCDLTLGSGASAASVSVEGGFLDVKNGASVSSADVGSGGYLFLESGGTISNLTLETGGSADLESQIGLGLVTVASNSYLGLGNGASATSVSIANGGGLEISSGGSVDSVSFTAPSGGGILIDGAFTLSAVISGFSAGDTIDITGFAYNSALSATLLSGGLLEIGSGDQNYDLNLDSTETYNGGFVLSEDYFGGTEVTLGSGGLFTSGADVVDFNNLTSAQQQAIASGADIYHGLGGDDVVTLPSVANYNESVGDDKTLGWTDTSQSTFYTGSLAVDTYTINGTDGSYDIVEGAGTETITITGDGSSVISAGSGQDNIMIDGNGNNVVSAGTGSVNLVISGGGQNVFSGLLSGTAAISGGSLTLDDISSGVATIGAGATLEISNGGSVTPIADTQINFAANTGSPETLKIDGNVMPTDTISGFSAGDTIDLASISFASGGTAYLTSSALTGGSTLVVSAGGQTSDLNLNEAPGAFANVSIALGSDGNGKTDISLKSGLSINLSYDSSITDNSKASAIENALQDVVQTYETIFTNPETLNIAAGWGEVAGQSASGGGHTISNLSVTYNYSQIYAAFSSIDPSLLSPLSAENPFANSNLQMTLAEAQAMGLAGNDGTPLDASVGFGAGDNWSFAGSATPAGMEDFIGAAEHELSEVMGRISLLDPTSEIIQIRSPMDLLRYYGPSINDLQPGSDTGLTSTAYFSLNNGSTDLGNWNNSLPNEDLGDWYPAGAPTLNDSFNYALSGGPQPLSNNDIALMNALGWTSPSSPSTTAVNYYNAEILSGQQLDLTNGISAFNTTILAGGILNVGPYSTANGIVFQGEATIELSASADLTGVISNLSAGDKIDFLDTSLASSDIEYNLISSDKLDITLGSGQSYQYQLANEQKDLIASEESDGNNGTDVVFLSDSPPCYCAGTLILTEKGEVEVEALAAGDLVITEDGKRHPIVWIGRRKVATLFADPIRSFPIRIMVGALGDNIPNRDLLVSPDHALLVEDVLIQAGALVNGTSIIRETRVLPTFIYYHIELEHHSLIFANGALAETFVDNVERMGFDNWAEHDELFPDGKPIEEMSFPRSKARRQVPRHIRTALNARANILTEGEVSAA